MKFYKILDNGSSCNGGDARWSLPKGDTPGEWMPEIEGDLVSCKNGYHLCREQDIIEWLGSEIYEAEFAGEIVESDGKVVVRSVRLVKKLDWNKEIARQFSADCTERALKFYKEKLPGDMAEKALSASYDRNIGRIERGELAAAMFVALIAARFTAQAFALTNTSDTGWDKAWNSKWYTERDWQATRLVEYLLG